MVNVLNCDIVVNKFKFQLCFYVFLQTNTLGKGMNYFIPSTPPSDGSFYKTTLYSFNHVYFDHDFFTPTLVLILQGWQLCWIRTPNSLFSDRNGVVITVESCWVNTTSSLIIWFLLFEILWFLPIQTQQVSWIWRWTTEGEVPVMLELSGMRSILSLLLLSGPLWPGVVAFNRVLSMGQIELNFVFMLNWIVWNGTVYTNKNRFGIDNLQYLMCHKNQTNPETGIIFLFWCHMTWTANWKVLNN